MTENLKFWNIFFIKIIKKLNKQIAASVSDAKKGKVRKRGKVHIKLFTFFYIFKINKLEIMDSGKWFWYQWNRRKILRKMVMADFSGTSPVPRNHRFSFFCIAFILEKILIFNPLFLIFGLVRTSPLISPFWYQEVLRVTNQDRISSF